MAFIRRPARYPPRPSVAMEGDVDRPGETSYGFPHPENETVSWQAEDRARCPAPREVIGQIGRIVFVCLVLGLLVRLLIAIVGVD